MGWLGEEPKIGKGRDQGGLSPCVWGASNWREECMFIVGYTCQCVITSETCWTSWRVGKEAWKPD